MQFFSHKIANPTGNTVIWDDYLAKLLNKQASEAKPECDDDPRGQCRGQVINNDNEEGAHSYQEGESVDGKSDQAEGGSKDKDKDKGKGKDKDKDKGKKAKPEANAKTKVKNAHCAKEMGECSKAGDVTEEHSEAGSADADAIEQPINNDPNYQKGESTSPGKVDGKNKKTDGKSKKTDGKSKKTEASKRSFKKIACLDHKEKLELFAHMTQQKNKSGVAAYPMPYIEAMIDLKFSNMKDDEKEWFRHFWRTLYPDSYVEEMVADR